MKNLVSLTIGHNVGDVPTFTTEEVVAAATTLLGALGATVISCRGMWQGMPEASTRIEVVTGLEADHIRARVEKLSHYMMQDCIMCEVKPTTIEFLG